MFSPFVLSPMGEKLGHKAQRQLEKMGVEVYPDSVVTDVDFYAANGVIHSIDKVLVP